MTESVRYVGNVCYVGNVRSSGTYGSYSSYSDLYNDTQSQDRHGNSDNAGV